MNHLLRELAPITEAGWQQLDDEAKDRLTPALAARKLVDFSGPHGWQHSATNLGRTSKLGAAPVDGVDGRRRRVLPLVELRAEFELAVEELRDTDRGAEDADLAPLDHAAHQLATAENVAVFDGWDEAIVGIGSASPHDPITVGQGAEGFTRGVAAAVELLLRNGVGGPYGLAVGGEDFREVISAHEPGGHSLYTHLQTILDGPIVWSPGARQPILVSLRGGDFLFDAGQDVSLGYISHDAETVRLYLEESFSFQVATPEAAVALTR
jgi:uncharacterized linocin/CFP29 family protein